MELDNRGPIYAGSTQDRHREERHFCSLYFRISDIIATTKRITDEQVASATEDIISSFYYHLGRSFSDVNYARYANVCAYLRRYGAHGAGLARCRVLEAAHNCEALRRLCAGEEEGPLRVVSLGGGPGNDALGFCSALWQLGFRDRDLRMTVVDAVEQWSDCVKFAVSLANEKDYGDVSEMFLGDQVVTLDFLQARLPVDEGSCLDALRDADVILMTRLLSIVEKWDERRDIIENLYLKMKDSALLLLIDVPFRPELWLDFDFLYLSDAERPYKMLDPPSGLDIPSNARIAVLRKHQVVTDSDSDSDY